MEHDPFAVEIVEMILNELNGGGEVGLIELVRNVPTNWTELASLLSDSVTTNVSPHFLKHPHRCFSYNYMTRTAVACSYY